MNPLIQIPLGLLSGVAGVALVLGIVGLCSSYGDRDLLAPSLSCLVAGAATLFVVFALT